MRNKILAIVLVVAVFLSGCIGQAPEKEVEEKPIIIGTTDKIITLDPANCYDYWSSNMIDNAMDGLVEFKPGTTEIVGYLATDWDISDDELTYTFYLRKGVKFQDGEPFNAYAVKWSLDRAMALNGDPAFLLTDAIESVTVIDEYTVQIKLLDKFGPFVSSLAYTVAYPISPKSAPVDAFTENAVGTGPYKITSYIPDEEMVLEVNEDYWGEKPKTKKIIIRFYENATALRAALEAGEIDIAFRDLNPDDYADFEKNPAFKVWTAPSLGIRYFVFNVQKPPFDDVRVRQAVAAAIDRKAITEQVFGGTVEPLYSQVPPGLWSHKESFKEKYGERNLELAKQLLRDAGYSETNPLKIELWFTPSHYGTTEADVATVAAASLEETGIFKVEIKSAEWATYRDYWRAGNMGLFLLGWYPDYIDPDNYTFPFASTAAGPSLGHFYSNEKMDDLLKKARQVSDVSERTALYHQIQDLMAEDVMICPLWNLKQYLVAKVEIKGVLLDPTMNLRLQTLYREPGFEIV